MPLDNDHPIICSPCSECPNGSVLNGFQMVFSVDKLCNNLLGNVFKIEESLLSNRLKILTCMIKRSLIISTRFSIF